MAKPLTACGRALLIALLAYFAWVEGPRWYDALLTFDGEDTARVLSHKHVPSLRQFAPEITVETSDGLVRTFICPKGLPSPEPGATVGVVTSSRFGRVSTRGCIAEKRRMGLIILLSIVPLLGFWLLYRLAIWHRNRNADTWSVGGLSAALPPLSDASRAGLRTSDRDRGR